MTFPDWKESTRLLEEAAGPPTAEQLDLAATIGLRYVGEPRVVFAAAIEAWLHPAIRQEQPKPATGRQLSFLDELGHEHEVAGLSRSVASAWIQHYLSVRTARALNELQLSAGDLIDQEHRHVDPTTGQLRVWFQKQTVSSIGRNGLVYFRGGNGRCGWPTQLRHHDTSQ